VALRTSVVLGALLTIIGLAALAAQVGMVATAAGALLFGIGGVLLISTAFYAVGRSEDRERERERRAREGLRDPE
jgi:membrane protein implicated in regulation of membrane protease activity